jgi:hypothetical protein
VTGAGPGTVTFAPGVYVLLGGATNKASVSLYIETGATVVGEGVLFYLTGSDYDPVTGQPDVGDGNRLGTDPNSGTTFGGAWLSAGELRLAPYADASGPLDGLLIYQRRWNTSPLALLGSSAQDTVSGTLYARWAPCTLAGPGAYQSPIVVGSLHVIPAGQYTIVAIGIAARAGKARQVFLVE